MVFRVPCLATLPTDIEHDLVVIPGIIKRRDIDLSPPVGEWPLFARNRRAATSVTRCELTFRRKLILRTSTTALRWKKGEGLPMQPGQSDDGAETATTREVERDNLVLSGAVEMTVGAKAQSTRPSKLGNV